MSRKAKLNGPKGNIARSTPIWCAYDKIVPLAQLKENPRNPNQHPPEQIKLLAHIIAVQGWRNPIVVSNRSGLITKGHARLYAARAIKAKDAPVDFQDYGSESEELADMIADNRIAELAEADRSMLRELFESMDTGAFDMDLTGFDQAALEELMTATMPENDLDAEPQIDKAEELRKKWGVERGQIWELGEHRLMCGDSCSASDVPRAFDGEVCKMGFSDPPYGVNYGNHENARGGKHKPIQNDGLKAVDLRTLLSTSFCLIAPFISGDLYVAAPPGPTHHDFAVALEQTPFECHQWLIWVKDRLVLGRSNYHYRHEHLWYGWKKGQSSSWSADRTKDSIFEIPRPSISDDHPTMKPVELVATTIRNSSNQGDSVADNFIGSGTTLIACEQVRRKCRAIEIDPGYVAVSLQRWADATGKTPKLLNG